MSTFLIILALFIGLMVTLQVVITVKTRQLRGRKLKGIGGELGEAIATGGRFLVYFYSPACRACRTQTPTIDLLMSEDLPVFKVNVAEEYALARTFGVTATPTTVVVDRATVAQAMVGTRSEAFLRETLM